MYIHTYMCTCTHVLTYAHTHTHWKKQQLIPLTTKEMQTKTTLKFLLTSVTVTKKTNDNKCWLGHGGGNVGTLQGSVNWYSHCGDQEVPPKARTRITIWPSFTTLVNAPEGLRALLQRDMHKHLLRLDSQQTGNESRLLYINGREDGRNEVHMHSGILFSCKDKWNYEKSMEMGGSEKCYIKWGILDSPCSLSYVDPSFKCRYMYLCEWACVEETRKGPVGELQNPSNLGVEERILGGEGLKQGWEHGDGR